MKGMVFTEFLDMVEDQYSYDVAERIIDTSDLPSKGVYTSVGSYDAEEMVHLCTALSTETKTSTDALLMSFGRRLFSTFNQDYPMFFEDADDAFSFLRKVEEYIHVEVKKLYPDAELPTFEYETPDERTLVMIYKSRNPFGKLAEGLIAGCVEHFGGGISVTPERVDDAGRHVRFTLVRE